MALHARAWTVFGSLALLMLLAVAGVNAFDEALTPEASALFARQEAAFMPDSGWALMAGFHAPPGEDARAYGAAIHRAGLSRKPGQEAATPADALAVRAAEELLCNPQEMDCVRAFARRPESIAELVADNAVLLARYEDLMRSRQLLDVLGVLDYYVANGPHYSTVMRTQQAGLSKAGADVAKGHHAEAIAWLQADASFQRRWLDEAGSTLTKMIALRALSRDLLVTGQVARAARGLSASEWQALERIAAPLSPTQRGFAPMLRAEASFFSQLLSEMRADSRRTSRIVEAPRLSAAIVAATIRPNATLNFAYPLFTDWMMLDAVPSAQLGAAIARVERRERDRLASDWRWAYNYTGRYIVAEQRPQAREYIYRLRDLDALAATIRCVVALRKDDVAPQAAAAFIASSPACVDPYETRALSWDPQNAELSFKPRAPSDVARFGGRGDRVTFRVLPAA